MPTKQHVLAISGSMRAGSTATAALRTAAAIAPAGTVVTVYDGLGTLPPFNPDDDVEPLHPAVRDLRRAVADAGGVLLSTPEYAGALPGPFTNLLDWTVAGGELAERPVGWINTSVSPTGAVAAHEDLRRMLTFVQAEIVEEACVDVPVPRASVGEDGLITDAALRERIGEVLQVLVKHVRARPRRPS